MAGGACLLNEAEEGLAAALDFPWSFVGGLARSANGARLRQGNFPGERMDIAADQRGGGHELKAGLGGDAGEVFGHRLTQQGPQRAEQGGNAGPEFRAERGDVHGAEHGGAGKPGG